MKTALAFTDLIDIVVKEPRIQEYGDYDIVTNILYEVFGNLTADFIFEFNNLNLYEQYAIVFFSAYRIAEQYTKKGVRDLNRLTSSVRRAIKQGVYRYIDWCWLPDWYKKVDSCRKELECINTIGVHSLERCEELYQTVINGEKLIDSVEYVYNSRERILYYYKMHKDRAEYLIVSLRRRAKK